MTTLSASAPAASRSLEHVTVDEAMHRGVFACPFDTPLVEVARMMASHRVHAIVGLAEDDDARVWGVVSDRDLVAMAAADGNPFAQTAGGSAATEALTIRRDDTLRHAAQLMHEHGVSHLLVVEPGSDRPVGVVSTLDVAAAVGGYEREEPRRGGTRVADLMTPRVVTVPPELPLKEAAAILVEHGISGMPVVRADAVVGVLSEADIVTAEQGARPARKRSLGWIVRGEGATVATRLAALATGDAMSSPAITIEPWRSAASAAALMTSRGIKRLPVLRDGELVGIVTRSDLVRAFARPDEEIEREIRDRIVLHEFWQVPDEVRVSVEGGHVTLSGTVDGEIVVEALPEEVQRMPGVVAVTSTLRNRGGAPVRFRRLRLR